MALVDDQSVVAHRHFQQRLPTVALFLQVVEFLHFTVRQPAFLEILEAGVAARFHVRFRQATVPAAGLVAPEGGAALALLGRVQIQHARIEIEIVARLIVHVDIRARHGVRIAEAIRAIVGRNETDGAAQRRGDAFHDGLAGLARRLAARIVLSRIALLLERQSQRLGAPGGRVGQEIVEDVQIRFAQEVLQRWRDVDRCQRFCLFRLRAGKADAARVRQRRMQRQGLRVTLQRQFLLSRAVVQLGQALQGLPALRAQGVGAFQFGDGLRQPLFPQQQFRMQNREIVLMRRQPRRRGVAGQRRLVVRAAQHVAEVVVEQGIVRLLLERQF